MGSLFCHLCIYCDPTTTVGFLELDQDCCESKTLNLAVAAGLCSTSFTVLTAAARLIKKYLCLLERNLFGMRRGPGTALCPDLATDNGVFPTDILGRWMVARHGPFAASLQCQLFSVDFLVRWRAVGCHCGAQAVPAMCCPVRQGTAGDLLCGCCNPLPGSRAELSSACVHMQGSIARAGSPSSSSSLVPELAGEPASKQNFPLLSLSLEAACLRRWLSVALEPAWEWAPLLRSSWVDSH